MLYLIMYVILSLIIGCSLYRYNPVNWYDLNGESTLLISLLFWPFILVWILLKLFANFLDIPPYFDR